MQTRDSLTDVPGLEVGHAEVSGGGSGCTVVLGPFRARVETRGPATGSRELATLAGGHVVPRVDAILLTGGSAFGLAAAHGVVEWLEERGRGHKTRVAPVPIVPAAVLYDLAPGRGRPGPHEGRAACDSASAGPVPEGRVGAGTGGTVGKLLGLDLASPGGLGSASSRVGPWAVGALVAVNAVGDVMDRSGRIVAGARSKQGSAEGSRGGSDEESDKRVRGAFRNGVGEVLERGPETGGVSGDPRPGDPLHGGPQPGLGENTTLAVVATDAPLAGEELDRMARLASTALARRISPVHTPFDGDLVFALTTAAKPEGVSARDLLVLGLAAREALETAILRGVGAVVGA